MADSSQVEDMAKYAERNIKGVLQAMTVELLRQTPAQPIDFMIDFLTEYKRKNPASAMAQKEEEEEEEPYVKPKGRRRRVGVSAEPMRLNANEEVKLRVIPKGIPETLKIREAMMRNFLFASLDKEQFQTVIDAMEEKQFVQGDYLIKQGDDGDEFYVLGEGGCQCFLDQPPPAPPRMVAQYKVGDSFGELALMYNVCRQASIRVSSPEAVAYAVDRATFRSVLQNSTAKKRMKYEDFLAQVPILQSLDQYERAKVADVLKEEIYQDGDYIITFGGTDKDFYILMDGNAKATKSFGQGQPETTVYEYKQGQFFGELALITDQPRAANIVSVGECRCVSLDRDSFVRLLGPCEAILNRNKANYAQIEQRLQG